MTLISSRLPRPVVVGLVVVGAIAAVVTAFVVPYASDTPGDQEVYALASERAERGEQFYRPDQVRAFTYPPFCVMYFMPMTGLDEPTRRGVWYLANFAMLAGVSWLLCRALDPMFRTDGPPSWVCVTLTTVLTLRFLISPLEYQGHDQIVFLLSLLGIVAWSRDRSGRAGFWTGLGAATKATPALFLPVFLWNRQWRAVGVFGIVAVGATLLPDLLYPANDGRSWVVTWYHAFVSKVEVGEAADARGAWISWNMLNQSLAGTMYRISTPVDVSTQHLFDVSLWSLAGRSLKLVTVGVQLFVLGTIVLVTWPGWVKDVSDRERSILRLGQGGAVLCAMLLLSPMSSKAHFCTLALPIAFVLADFLYRRRDLLVGGAILAVFCMGTLTSKDLLGKELGDRVLAYGSLTWCTMICLLAVTRCVVSRSREMQRAAAAEPEIVEFPEDGANDVRAAA